MSDPTITREETESNKLRAMLDIDKFYKMAKCYTIPGLVVTPQGIEALKARVSQGFDEFYEFCTT